MTYHEVEIPSALAAVNDDTDSSIVRYYNAAAAVVAGFAGKEAQVASVQFSGHDGESAFEGSIDKDDVQERLEQAFRVSPPTRGWTALQS